MDLLDWQKIWSSAILLTSVLNELIGYSTWPLENNQNLFQTYMNKIAELHDFYLSRSILSKLKLDMKVGSLV